MKRVVKFEHRHSPGEFDAAGGNFITDDNNERSKINGLLRKRAARRGF